MAIICDNKKHDHNTIGLPVLSLNGVLPVGKDGKEKETVKVNLRLQVKGKHLCQECFAELIKQMDFTALVKEAVPVPAPEE